VAPRLWNERHFADVTFGQHGCVLIIRSIKSLYPVCVDKMSVGQMFLDQKSWIPLPVIVMTNGLESSVFLYQGLLRKWQYCSGRAFTKLLSKQLTRKLWKMLKLMQWLLYCNNLYGLKTFVFSKDYLLSVSNSATSL